MDTIEGGQFLPNQKFRVFNLEFWISCSVA